MTIKKSKPDTKKPKEKLKGTRHAWTPGKFSADRAIYERQEKESSVAHEAFVVYRDMPNRSHAGAARIIGKAQNGIDRWGKIWRWQERIVEYERELDRQVINAQIAERKKAAVRHLRIAEAMQAVGGQHMIKTAKAIQDGKDVELSHAEARKSAETGIKLERLIQGDVTERSETVNIDVTKLTDEQLDLLIMGEDPTKVVGS